jgi:RHS repeat-associated protein
LTQGYDNQYRISSILAGSILNLTFGYDPNGNVISIVDANNPTGVEDLENPETYSYQTGTNKLIHIETTPPIDIGYDENANITTETGWTYVYDLSNQLIRVFAGASQVGEYTYNGAGQRIKKVTQTETRIFHYDLWGHLIAETNQSGQMLAEYVYLGDQLLSMIKPGEAVYYFHNDHLGTPQVLTNDSQAISWKAVYTPFGEAVPSIQTVDNPFRFPGQYYDQETGLHYNYFRYYNPQTGRYITPDPIGLEGGINLFSYVQNNPVNFRDRVGLLDRVDEVFPPSPAFTECVKNLPEESASALKKAVEEYDQCKKDCDEDAKNRSCLIVKIDSFTNSLLTAKCKSDCLTTYLSRAMKIHYITWAWGFGCFALYQDPYGGGKEKDYLHTHDDIHIDEEIGFKRRFR